MFESKVKELKNEFKKTKYGKKTNKMLHISIIISLFLFILSFVIFIVIGLKNNFIFPIHNIWLNVLFILTIISSIISCYFDGKRDGAIEQFKIDSKK